MTTNNSVQNNGEKINKRQFFSLIGGWISVILSFSGISVAFVRFLFPKVIYGAKYKIRIGKPKDFELGSVTFLEEDRVFIFRNGRGFQAISAICTHLRCIVRHNAEGTFSCPCHGSRFDEKGRVIGGPAPKPLDWFSFSQKRDGTLILNKRAIVDSNEVFVPKIT